MAKNGEIKNKLTCLENCTSLDVGKVLTVEEDGTIGLESGGGPAPSGNKPLALVTYIDNSIVSLAVSFQDCGASSTDVIRYKLATREEPADPVNTDSALVVGLNEVTGLKMGTNFIKLARFTSTGVMVGDIAKVCIRLEF